jgi:hypothetical protein
VSCAHAVVNVCSCRAKQIVLEADARAKAIELAAEAQKAALSQSVHALLKPFFLLFIHRSIQVRPSWPLPRRSIPPHHRVAIRRASAGCAAGDLRAKPSAAACTLITYHYHRFNTSAAPATPDSPSPGYLQGRRVSQRVRRLSPHRQCRRRLAGPRCAAVCFEFVGAFGSICSPRCSSCAVPLRRLSSLPLLLFSSALACACLTCAAVRFHGLDRRHKPVVIRY